MRPILTSAAALILAAGAAGAQDVIRMGTEGAYAPYNFINENGEVDGFERDLGDALCERAGLTCEWVTTDWDSMIPNLVSGNYDTIMAGMSITDEREATIDFTQPYYPPAASAFLTTAAMEGTDPTGGAIAAQTGTIQADYVASNAPQSDLVEFATADETIAALRNGQVDAVLGDRSFVRTYADENDDLALTGEPVYLDDGIGMGLRESDDELLETFDTAIGEMKADGSLNDLLVEWFGEDTATFDDADPS